MTRGFGSKRPDMGIWRCFQKSDERTVFEAKAELVWRMFDK